MATSAADDDITIVDSTYNIKLKDAISEKFIRDVTHPNILMRILQKYNSDVLIDVDIDYVKTKLEKDGRMTANEALLDRLYRYKNWFQCLLQAVKDDSIKLGFLEKEFQACKDDLDEQILAPTHEEIESSTMLHPDHRASVSQRRENMRLKIVLAKQRQEVTTLTQKVSQLENNNENLNRQHGEMLKMFEAQLKELNQELQILKQDSANQKEEMTRLKQEKEIIEENCKEQNINHQELKKEVNQGKISHDELRREFITEKDSHNELKREFAEEKNSHDELRNISIPQINVTLEKEKNSTIALNEKLKSLIKEKEDLKVEVKLLKEEPALPTSLGQFLDSNSDKMTCFVSEQWNKMHHNGLTLLFVGITGAGKSETGNTILGRRAFNAHDENTTFEDIGIECCKYKGISLKLVDGPGFPDCATGDLFQRFISKIGATLGHGVDVFIFVWKYGSGFSMENREILTLLKKNFGSDFLRNFCVFLTTYGDYYELEHKEKKSFSEYCSNLVGPQKELIEECRGAVLFDNRTGDVNVKERQMKSLLYLIGKKISHRRSPAFKIPSEFKIVSI